MRIFSRWPFPRRRGRSPREPGAALFQGIRMRLTLWYCGVLGAALILFGVALYLGSLIVLLNPIETNARLHAQAHASQWLGGSHDDACPPFGSSDQHNPPGQGQGFFMPELVVCFDQNGALLPGEDISGLPAAFLSNSVAQTALHSPTQDASDTVNGGGNFGQIYRYARVVSGNQGVVVIGESIQAQMDTLSSLLMLLLTIGGGALLCAALGGLFLAHRALAPARLAWENQQRFIADASHELRTPLTLLRADAEVLLRGSARLEAEDAALVEDIITETNHMTAIITNLLTLARLDARASHQEHEVVSITELAQKGARRVQALAEQRGITVREEHTGNPYVIGDPMLLEQAVLALLDNAIKYNRQGGQINVRTGVRNEYAFLEVQDTGIGIPTEHLPHLGKRFYRVDKARSRAAGGTGLGLSITRGIATTHGGQLTLTSAPGQGTTVSLTLPLARGTLSKTSDSIAEGRPAPSG
jgi:signal transduction histidine kinase